MHPTLDRAPPPYPQSPVEGSAPDHRAGGTIKEPETIFCVLSARAHETKQNVISALSSVEQLTVTDISTSWIHFYTRARAPACRTALIKFSRVAPPAFTCFLPAHVKVYAVSPRIHTVYTVCAHVESSSLCVSLLLLLRQFQLAVDLLHATSLLSILRLHPPPPPRRRFLCRWMEGGSPGDARHAQTPLAVGSAWLGALVVFSFLP